MTTHDADTRTCPKCDGPEVEGCCDWCDREGAAADWFDADPSDDEPNPERAAA